VQLRICPKAPKFIEAVEVIEIAEVLRSGKSLLRTSGSFSILEFSFTLMFRKKLLFW
jgi:hypothetical protein